MRVEYIIDAVGFLGNGGWGIEAEGWRLRQDILLYLSWLSKKRTIPGLPYLLVLGLSFRTNVRNLRMMVEISPFGRNDRKG